ncbi:Asp-tRNA(Asn)/Glu-tRNA(Gln) amidotransferase subunit GatA, partial [Candidatus Parcubacteria bacterium]|nr:Asp-tRNA(Asn)/Glu-tRNA(Gln) amidotransferase subunit GatA [Candidatus Parcubacteria bacterium]
VKKLKNAGAVILGKTNLDEFAMGSSTEYSAFFPTKNPLDLTKVPGGSSGGSAAAVSANFCSFALGSDTGGSVRQPASFCAIVGLKPTYGRVSRFGLIAFASSLDQIGPMTKTVQDCEIVFDTIKGKDELDSTTVEVQEPIFNFSLKNLILGIPKEYLIEGIEKEVEKKFFEVVKFFEKKGAKILEISLPHTKYALSCYYIVAPAEASSNLARYDLLKYGKKEKIEAHSLDDFYLKAREKNFGKEVKRRIILGTFVLSVGYFEEFYQRAQKVRKKIAEDFEKAFEKVHLILTPTSPTLPFSFGERMKNPVQMYLSDIFTVSSNLAGLPAISIPIEKKPIGFQLIAPPFHEKILFETGKIYERNNE